MKFTLTNCRGIVIVKFENKKKKFKFFCFDIY